MICSASSSTAIRLTLSALGEMVSSASIRYLNLSNNNVTDITGLHFLSLAGNILIGQIPPEIGRCLNLKTLDLGSNYLVGKIPSFISNISCFTNYRVDKSFDCDEERHFARYHTGKLDRICRKTYCRVNSPA
ncbi:Uncharacterized protein TCM_030720 [Theobroma cacao]|uniref:Uncharacterized protein n=1 Tax=Theobroma cacao TaxID=3641 RepID=A0A061FCB3_THECC|nr:Uncharacterized protein TCM_030720 [Theobroma cacao]